MEAEGAAEVGDAYLMVGLSKDRECVLRHIVLDVGREDALKSPYTRVVVGRISDVVLRVSLVEVELSLGRVVESVLCGELNEVG